jgi:DNA-binding transcriptional MerR regulator
MTIDELARRTGTTARNIRAHQERGLLPSPRIEGRVGLYTEAHAARLRHIAALQERGFSLAAIRELFQAWERGHGLAQVLGFEEALAAPWETEAGEDWPVERIEAVFGLDEELLRRSLALGLLEEDGDSFRAPSPSLVSAGAQLVLVGVPLEAVLDEAEALRADLERVADRFVQLFLRYVWEPFRERGMPAEELPTITEALHRLRPIAGATVGPLLAQAMAARVDAAGVDTLSAPPPGGPPE